MFRQATVQDVAKNRITKRHGKIVVVTRYYPRYLAKSKIDGYHPQLAPSKELLRSFKNAEEDAGDHDSGFEAIDYEAKFELGPEGLAVLEELNVEAETMSVYLVCHCALGQYCHRELLLLIAENRFGARIPAVSHAYVRFRARLSGIVSG